MADPSSIEEAVRIPVGDQALSGDLTLPPSAAALIVFAHGSGSSRHSPRNRYVAGVLQQRGLGTLLIDLLTTDEDEIDARTAELRFDIDLLARRLITIIDWVASQPALAKLRIGLFGASTGAAAALMAAAARPDQVCAVVSRGGRPDLARDALPHVTAPTLLIVGGRDTPVIGMNQDAMARMRATVSLEIVAGATHLFEERGALARVAELAADFFGRLPRNPT
jgi:dienelactone hydrolase